MTRDDVRLLTLTGPGGIGKTRLAHAAATEAAAGFADGAWFVDLVPVVATTDVPAVIAGVLGLGRRRTPGTRIEWLTRSLGQREILVVLDNLEHLRGVEQVVAGLLIGCPGLKLLATSRAPLSLRWEHRLPVPPLAVPSVRRHGDIAALASVPAVALFLARARAADPSFALTSETAAVVAEICTRLDGHPLAIELAAARTATLSPRAVLAHLEHLLPFLRGGALDAPERHRTLRAAIGWSYDLLEPADQRLMRCMGVFVGGCTPESLAAVAGDRTIADTSDALGRLVLGSLARPGPDANADQTYALTEPVREYAAEQLAAAGESEATRARHAAYFALTAERALAGSRGSDRTLWSGWLARNQGNLRAAHLWARESGAPETEAQIRRAIRTPAPAVARAADAPPGDALTEREKAVLRLVADGLPTKQIARALEIGERTVKGHLTAAMSKLGADNRAHAAVLALERRLL